VAFSTIQKLATTQNGKTIKRFNWTSNLTGIAEAMCPVGLNSKILTCQVKLALAVVICAPLTGSIL
jgi:hypothetical protein